MKRLIGPIAILVLLAPLGAPAATTASYGPPYAAGPQGGDSFNRVVMDQNTGDMAVVRVNPVPGAFNCTGGGGFANFAVSHTGTGISSVKVSFTNAVVDPYTWFNVGVRQGDDFLDSKDLRGPLVGEGSVTVPISPPADGSITVWFGIQVASACPNVDGGRATFTSVEVAQG